MKLRVPLQIGPSALNRILDGIANSLHGTFLIVKNYAAHAKRAGREYVLRLVIDKDYRAGIDGGIVEDMSVKPEVGLSLASVG